MSDRETVPTPAATPPANPSINIVLKDTQNNEVHFKIKRTTRFEKVFKAFAERQGRQVGTCRFRFDGDPIDALSTPGDIDMQDGDLIDVFEEQVGGA